MDSTTDHFQQLLILYWEDLNVLRAEPVGVAAISGLVNYKGPQSSLNKDFLPVTKYLVTQERSLVWISNTVTNPGRPGKKH